MKIHNQAMKRAGGTAAIASPSVIVGDADDIVVKSTMAAPVMTYGVLRHETNGSQQIESSPINKVGAGNVVS